MREPSKVAERTIAGVYRSSQSSTVETAEAARHSTASQKEL